MEHQEIPIRFADLRRLAREVPAYLAREMGVRATPPLRTGVEDEFQIAGADTESLILQFSEAYRVNVEFFDFTNYISPDGPDLKGCLLFGPLLLYLLAGWLLKASAAGLCWLWRSALAGRIWRWQLPPFGKMADASKFLTAGDFVASAAVGRFVLRKQVRFQLVRA